MRSLLQAGAMALLCLTLSGCFLQHKTKAVVPVAAQTPVPIENAPEPKTEPVIAQVPETPVPLPAVKVPAQKVKKPKKKVVVQETPPAPVQMASAVPPPPPVPEAVIGALTVGGDDAPEKKRYASGMISDLTKRLAGLGADTLEKQKEGIARVRYFEKEARTALDSGDVEGAVTLVTKAKVLLDDLTK